MSGEALAGGELNASVTSALVGIHSRHLGRGPKSATTFHHGNVLITLMYDVLTPAERTLAQREHVEVVNQVRRLFQETLAPEFKDVVQRLTGRSVTAFISGNTVAPDIAAEVFILDAPI